MSDHKQNFPTFSYAELLTTATTLINLDHCLKPWFSDEIRSSLDPRVEWVTLDQVDHSELHNIKDQRVVPSPLATQVESSQQAVGQAQGGEAVAGHYLDHIERVQQRDNHSGSSHKKRRRKSSRKKDSQQEAAANSRSENKENVATPMPSKRRRRPSRNRKPKSQSST